MNIPAYNLKAAPSGLEDGVVWEEEAGIYKVETQSGLHWAKPAVNCIVKPEKNDRVAIFLDGQDRAFILGVLERPEENGIKSIVFQGRVQVKALGGSLDLVSDRKIDLIAPGLEATAENMSLNAQNGSVRMVDGKYLGQKVDIQVKGVKLAAQTLDAVFRRAVTRLKSCFRYIQDHDEVQSGSSRILVKGAMTLKSGDMVQKADGQMKIDARQIHLG